MIGAEDSERHRISSAESTTSEPLRHDLYEDYDELADLAITSSEPPPPGTTSFQEELMSLITDNTAPGVSIDKKEIATWLQDEDAMLMGREEKAPSKRRSSSMSSIRSYPSSHDDSHDDSEPELQSPPRKISSVAFKSRDRNSRDPCGLSLDGEGALRRSEEERFRSKDNNGPKRHTNRWSSNRRRRSRSPRVRRQQRQNHRRESHHRATRHWARRHSDPTQGRITPPRSHANSSRRSSPPRRKRQRSPERTVSRIEIKRLPSKKTSRVASRVGSPPPSTSHRGAIGMARKSTPEGSRSRRVKIGRKVDHDHDRNNSKFYHREEAAPRITVHGVRDARELISSRAPSTEEEKEESGISPAAGDDMIRQLEEQIRINELEARRLSREARHAKQKMDEYLSLTLHRETRSPVAKETRSPSSGEGLRPNGRRDRRGGSVSEHGGSRGSRRRNPSDPEAGRKRSRKGSSRHDAGGHRRRHSDDQDGDHVTRRRNSSGGGGRSCNISPSSHIRHNNTTDDNRITDPKEWKLLRPNEVKGFNSSGPTVFVQNLGRGIRRGHLFAHFKAYGSIVDIQFIELHKEKTACVIFSRKTESEKVFDDYNGDIPKIINVIHPIRENKFDVLLNALRRSEVS